MFDNDMPVRTISPSPELLKTIQEYIQEHYRPSDADIACEAAMEHPCGETHAFGAAPASAAAVSLSEQKTLSDDSPKLNSTTAAKALFSLNQRKTLSDGCPQFYSTAVSEDEELNRKLQHLDESFAETLLRKIDESGMTDADCYHKAQLNRSHFNKIKNDPGYNIRKNTVLALILALSLGREDADEMLTKAGYALSPSSKSDLIIEYCIDHKIYDITEVNRLLYAFDQELLGAGIRE